MNIAGGRAIGMKGPISVFTLLYLVLPPIAAYFDFFSHVFYGSNLEEDCQISWYNPYRVGHVGVGSMMRFIRAYLVNN